MRRFHDGDVQAVGFLLLHFSSVAPPLLIAFGLEVATLCQWCV